MNAPAMPGANFIANAWRAPASGDVLPMIDPSDGTQFATIAAYRVGEVLVDQGMHWRRLRGSV